MLETVDVGYDIIAIGGSAGSVAALVQVVQGFPPDLPAAVFVVVHSSPRFPSLLPEILQRSGPLPAVHSEDGAPIEPGRIYVAPPDRHLLVKPEYMRVVFGPKENRFRPAIDPLFRTAAQAYGKRVIGIVLSGLLSDGTAGRENLKSKIQNRLTSIKPKPYKSSDYFLLNRFAKSKTAATGEFFCITNNKLA